MPRHYYSTLYCCKVLKSKRFEETLHSGRGSGRDATNRFWDIIVPRLLPLSAAHSHFTVSCLTSPYDQTATQTRTRLALTSSCQLYQGMLSISINLQLRILDMISVFLYALKIFLFILILQKKRYCCVVSLTTFICFDSDFNGFIFSSSSRISSLLCHVVYLHLSTSPLVVLKAVSPIALHPPRLPHILGVTSWCMIPQYF